LIHTSFGQKGFALILKLKLSPRVVAEQKQFSVRAAFHAKPSYQLLTVNTEEQMNSYASKREAEQNTMAASVSQQTKNLPPSSDQHGIDMSNNNFPTKTHVKLMNT